MEILVIKDETLREIADAIRMKTAGSERVPVKQMAQAIRDLEVSIDGAYPRAEGVVFR